MVDNSIKVKIDYEPWWVNDFRDVHPSNLAFPKGTPEVFLQKLALRKFFDIRFCCPTETRRFKAGIFASASLELRALKRKPAQMSAANSPSFPTPDSVVPAEFPRAKFGAVPGFQSKILAVQVGDTYAQGMSESEAHARYEICFDLLNQLETYSHRKLIEHPDWTPRVLFSKLRKGVARRYDWGCSPAELQWILTQLCIRMNWVELVDENLTIELKSMCSEVTITDQKFIDKLLGHKYGPDGSLLPPARGPETIVDQVRRKLGSGPTTEVEQE